MPRYFNYSTVGFTPQSSSLVSLDGVTSIRFDDGGSTAEFRGDNDRFPTTRVADYQNPSFTLTMGNLKKASQTLAHGTKGTFTYILLEATAGTGTDAITVATASNTAMVETRGHNAPHGQFGTSDIRIRTTSADGSTNPVSYSYAS